MTRNLSDMPEFYRVSKFDIVLILLVIVLSVFSIPGITQGSLHRKEHPARALIYVGGTLYASVDLGKNAAVAVPFKESRDPLRIEVAGGKIRVVKSDCPRSICQHQGAISFPGQTIVCVPNKVLVAIESDAASLSLDAVVQ